MDVTKSPADLVDLLTKTGLSTKGGFVKLNRYCSSSPENGGAQTAQGLLGSIQKKLSGDDKTSVNAPMFDPKTGETLKGKTQKVGVMTGFNFVDWADVGKGQGQAQDFVRVWNWMYDHLDEIMDVEITLYDNHPASKKPDGTIVKQFQTPGPKKKLSDYFDATLTNKDDRFQRGVQALVADKAWGWDCIGFVANYLRWINLYPAYPGLYPSQFIGNGGFKEVNSLAEVGPLCVVAHGNVHIQIINSVDDIDKSGRLSVTLCQSSGIKDGINGPMTHSEVKVALGKGGGFFLSHEGDPVPVMGACKIGKHPKLKAVYADADNRPASAVIGAGREVMKAVGAISSRLPLIN